MKISSIVGAVFNVVVASATFAQTQPTMPVNLFVSNITYTKDSTQIGAPRKLTGDKGINSQPSFTPDGEAILFVRRDSAAGEGDVYRIDIATGKETRITNTPEMENSPTVTPDGNLMVIRWTPATLFKEWGPWIYGMNGQPIKGVLPGPDTVGYYTRVDANTIAMMRPKSVRAVALFDIRKQTLTDYDFGSANLPPQRIPGKRAISYVRVDTVAGNSIRRLDLVTHDTTTIAPTVPGKTVHTWTPRGSILMARGNAIFELRRGSKTWVQIASFNDPEIQDVNAYVVSPRGDKLILISPLKPPSH